MSRLSQLIRTITKWGSTPSRLDHLEDIARELLKRDIPYGEVAGDTLLPASGTEFPLPVDSTSWMDMGQRLQVRTDTNLVYLEIMNVVNEGVIICKVLEMIGFSVGDTLKEGSKIVVGLPPRERVGYITSSVGLGWVQKEDGWSPIDSNATITCRFVDGAGSRERTVQFSLDKDGAFVRAAPFNPSDNDIGLEVINNGTAALTFRFTDELSSIIREHTVFAVTGGSGQDGVDGTDGADAASMIFQGGWNATTNYYATSTYKSVVIYEERLYVAKLDSFNKEPVVGQSDSYWEYIEDAAVNNTGSASMIANAASSVIIQTNVLGADTAYMVADATGTVTIVTGLSGTASMIAEATGHVVIGPYSDGTAPLSVSSFGTVAINTTDVMFASMDTWTTGTVTINTTDVV